jgi:hypothetical protein
MNPIAILAVTTAPDGGDLYMLISPTHAFLVTPVDRVPDDMLDLMRDIAERGDVTPLGVVLDLGLVDMTQNTHGAAAGEQLGREDEK